MFDILKSKPNAKAACGDFCPKSFLTTYVFTLLIVSVFCCWSPEHRPSQCITQNPSSQQVIYSSLLNNRWAIAPTKCTSTEGRWRPVWPYRQLLTYPMTILLGMSRWIQALQMDAPPLAFLPPVGLLSTVAKLHAHFSPHLRSTKHHPYELIKALNKISPGVPARKMRSHPLSNNKPSKISLGSSGETKMIARGSFEHQKHHLKNRSDWKTIDWLKFGLPLFIWKMANQNITWGCLCYARVQSFQKRQANGCGGCLCM